MNFKLKKLLGDSTLKTFLQVLKTYEEFKPYKIKRPDSQSRSIP